MSLEEGRELIDRARHKNSRKAGGGRRRVYLSEIELTLDEPNPELLVLDDALRELERKDPRKAEVVKLRFFAGLTGDQAAAALGVSPRAADALWAYARAWLFEKLQRERR